ERRNDRDATKSTSHAGTSPVGFIDARPCRGWGGSGSLRRGRATAPTTLGRRFLVLGGAALAVLDLLEDLAHPGPHQLAGLRRGLTIAPADPGGFARVETFVVGHRREAPAPGRRRWSRITPANRSVDPATSGTTIGRTSDIAATGVSVGGSEGMAAPGGGTTPGPKSWIASAM